MKNPTVYYTTVGGALTVTLSERVLQHAIDRTLAAKTAGDAGATAAGQTASACPWLGSTAALRVNSRILEIGNILGRDEYRRRMQNQCWDNLLVLNEWKQLFPDRDPVEVHRQVWGVTLVCPGGGKYVWNDQYQTMESTAYGSRNNPKEGPLAPPVLNGFKGADFGLTMEKQGLRVRVELRRTVKQ